MKIFHYIAVDNNGNKITGYFNGDEIGLNLYLSSKKLFLISYEIKNKKLKSGKIVYKDILNFLEELHYLISSGLDIEVAFKKLIESAYKVDLQKFYDKIFAYMKEGETLSKSIENTSKDMKVYIDKIIILLIKVNENIGKLDLGIKQAYDYLEFKENIKKTIIQSLSYPMFLIIMSVLLVFFVFVYIVPKFYTIFSPSDFEKLPMLSKIILQTGEYVNSHLNVILISFFVIIGVSFFYRKQVFKFLLENLFFKINYFRDIITSLQLSYFFSSLSLMLKGGLDIKKALKESINLLTVTELKQSMNKVYEDIKNGISISDSLKYDMFVDSNVVSLIAAGESSGNLDEVLDSVSKKYMQNFVDKVKTAVSLLEPVVIILMGGIIAVIVIAIMMAIMSISDVV